MAGVFAYKYIKEFPDLILVPSYAMKNLAMKIHNIDHLQRIREQ